MDNFVTASDAGLASRFGEGHSFSWEPPRDWSHGDLASTFPLRLSKELGKPPREIAEECSSFLSSLSGVASVEVAGPGYINVRLEPSVLLSMLSSTQAACSPALKRQEDPLIIEYSQPNIAKPLGIHHIMSTVIGQSIANIASHLGHPVIKWNYLGDWGTQFGKLAVAMQKWGAGRSASDLGLDGLLDLYVQFHEEAESDASLEDEARATFRKLEQGDEQMRAFWKEVVAVTKTSLAPLYDRLSVSFDLDLGESFYEDKMDLILEEGKKKDVFVEGKEGALIVEFAEDTNLPVYMVQKGDGGTLYSTRDIAQMRYRIDTYHPSAILIVTDRAQELHFRQLHQTCKQLGWDLPQFENIVFGRMRFADRKMSTRKGNILRLSEVLDEAHERADAAIASHGDRIQADNADELAEMMGIGSIVFGILSQSRKLDLTFSFEQALSLEGATAPYLQYTHARARSVLRKSEESSFDLPADAPELSVHDRTLLNLLLQFPTVLEEAFQQRLPHKLAQYLVSLAQQYNSLYAADPILQAEDNVRTLRLALTDVTASVLRTGCSLLTVQVPERM